MMYLSLCTRHSSIIARRPLFLSLIFQGYSHPTTKKNRINVREEVEELLKMCTIPRRNIRHFILTIEKDSTRIYSPGDTSLHIRRLSSKGMVRQTNW